MTRSSRISLTPVPSRQESVLDGPEQSLLRSGLVAFALVENNSIIATSPALRDMLDRTSPYQHVDGQDLLGIVAGADRPGVEHYCYSLLRSGARADHRCRMLRADGSEVCVLLSGTAVQTGETQQLVLLFTDLSPWIDQAAMTAATTLPETFDRTTGFPARALLLDRMGIALAAARRYRRRAALLRIELRNFQNLLKALQPRAADELQATVAETLRNCARDCDTFARIGEQEFVLLLPEISQRDDAGISAARIVDAIAQMAGCTDQAGSISAHIGVALYPTDGTNPERLLQVAQSALQAASTIEGGGFALADATSAELAAFEPLELRPDCLVGIDRIDAEHRALVDQTNALVRHLRGGTEPLALTRDINEMLGLLAQHFATEAELLDTSPYDGSIDQKSRNLRFLDELHCILLHASAQSVMLAVRHIYDWLVPHLAQMESRKAVTA